MVNLLQSRLRDSSSGNRRIELSLTKTDQDSILSAPVDLIQPDPDQPRKSLGNLDELAKSILEHGIINPIIVRSMNDESYVIIAGERRYAAAKQAGLEEVPVIVRDMDSHKLRAVQIIENLHRKDLHPIEEATAYKQLMDDHGLSQAKLARELGKSRPSINETLRILSIDETLLDKCRTSDTPVSRSLLLEIAKEPDVSKQQQMIAAALSGNLTVSTVKKSSRKKNKLSNKSRHNIKTSMGDIKIVFNSSSYLETDVIAVLEEAISQFKT
jgi:ParB family chromosome partitioning protein